MQGLLNQVLHWFDSVLMPFMLIVQPDFKIDHSAQVY